MHTPNDFKEQKETLNKTMLEEISAINVSDVVHILFLSKERGTFLGIAFYAKMCFTSVLARKFLVAS